MCVTVVIRVWYIVVVLRVHGATDGNLVLFGVEVKADISEILDDNIMSPLCVLCVLTYNKTDRKCSEGLCL